MTISEEAALGSVYGVLFCCSGVAAAAAFTIHKQSKAEQGAEGHKKAVDFWYSARGSQGWVSLGLSFFASSMGGWVLFAAPEVGVLQGWWGNIGYALASSLPFGFMAVLGPFIRNRMGEGFALTDWVRQRFGRTMQVYVGLVSLFYMWIYLVAELTSIGNLIVSFAGLDALHALIPLALVTMLYTTLAGLPASIWTDRLQGVFMSAFVVITCIACYSDVNIQERNWNKVSVWTDKGFESLITLTLAILGAELFNMSNWQRVYASVDEANLRKGCAFGAALIFPTMLLFGLAGMLAEAQDRGREVRQIEGMAFLSFFNLLSGLPTALVGFVFALAVSMVASSVDSLQTGLVSVLSTDILAEKRLSPMKSLLAGQAFLLVVNIGAIICAAESIKDPNLSVGILNMFLIADLLALSIAVPVFMGLGRLATQFGSLVGCASGLIFIFAYGWVEFGTFMAGLEMVTLMSFGNSKATEFGLSASRTCIIFFLLPIITGAVTYIASWMDHVSRKFGFAEDGEKPGNPAVEKNENKTEGHAETVL